MLLDAMEFDFKRGKLHLKPDAYTYSSVIDCLVKYETIKAPEKAEQVLDRMKELHRLHGGDPPTANVVNAGTLGIPLLCLLKNLSMKIILCLKIR